MAEATFLAGDSRIIEIDAPANVTSGEIIALADDRAAVVTGLNADLMESGSRISVAVEGVVRVPSASGVTFSDGDAVYWDVSANTAIASANTDDGDLLLGPAIGEKVSSDLTVDVDLNAPGGTLASS